jgi:putative hydrolase of the HAD superfamily
MIKAIIFDYGGVMSGTYTFQELLRQKYQNEIESRIKIDELYKAWWPASETGDTEDFWKKLSEDTSMTVAESKKLMIKSAEPLPEMLALVKELKTEYKTGLLSNHIPDWLNPIIDKCNLNTIFDSIVTSYTAGVAKPAAGIYLKALELLEVQPDEVLFIDDLEVNVKAAQKLGLNAVLFTTYHELLRTLIVVGVDCDFLAAQRKVMDMESWNEYLKTGKAISNEEMQSWLKELISGKHTKWEDRKLKISDN